MKRVKLAVTALIIVTVICSCGFIIKPPCPVDLGGAFWHKTATRHPEIGIEGGQRILRGVENGSIGFDAYGKWLGRTVVIIHDPVLGDLFWVFGNLKATLFKPVDPNYFKLETDGMEHLSDTQGVRDAAGCYLANVPSTVFASSPVPASMIALFAAFLLLVSGSFALKSGKKRGLVTQ